MISAKSVPCRSLHGSQEKSRFVRSTSGCGGGSGFIRPLSVRLDDGGRMIYTNSYSRQVSPQSRRPPYKGQYGRTYGFPRSFLRRRDLGPEPCPGSSSGNGANPLHNYPYNQVFFETGCFKQEKTVQFSRVPLDVKNRLISRLSGTPGLPGIALWPKNKGGS